MIGRRSILAALLGAPAALSVSSDAQVPMPTSGNTTASGPDPVWKKHSKLTRALESKVERGRFHSDPNHFPAHISTKKSWSPAFKEACFRKEFDESSELLREINDAMFDSDNPISRGMKLAKLAKRIGV